MSELLKFQVRNNDDYKFSHVFLKSMLEDNESGRFNDKIIELKRKMRNFLKENKSDRKLAYADKYGDSCVLLITLPPYVKTKGDAEEWFENCERIQFVYRSWDCTGQKFTISHKCFQRNGQWMCYHVIGIDC